MDSGIFNRQDLKYSALWAKGYKNANWKRLARIGLKIAKAIDNPVLIDFGFGNGSAMNYFRKKRIVIEGIEISKYATDLLRVKGKKIYHTSLDDLSMLIDNQFNLGFCNDVIQHVPENLVKHSLDEMTRVCSDYLLISVCPKPSHHISLDGKNLHLTIKPKKWWEELFQKYGRVEEIQFWFSHSLRYIISL